MRLWPWWALGGGGLALAAVLAAAAAGALGSLVTCGADGATVCIAWSGLASAITWLGFVAIIAGLAACQARDWHSTSVDRREILLLLAVLVAALAERTWRLDLADVGYDEASAASLIAAWRLDGAFPLTGIVSSVGIPNPPGWPYLLAVALLWFDSPQAVVALGIVTGMLAVLLCWWVGRRWLGAWGALATAVFYAAGFWASFLGRGGWQPIFLQLPVILCLDALLILAIRRRPWALAVACGWLGLMVQLHYIALVFAAMLPIAAWPARREIRPSHLVAGVLLAAALLSPFLIYELNPAVRFRDFGLLSADAGGQGSHWDLEAWNLMWTLASNGGVAGLGGPDTEGLRQALGRWSNLGMVGVPLVASGLIAAIVGWPRGWRGGMIVAWALTPAVGLAHHTLGLLFHYLYLALPGMALAVGALAEWAVHPRIQPTARVIVAGALAVYAAVSAATLAVVLAHVQQTGVYPGSARPLGLSLAAAEAARAVLTPGEPILIGGQAWEVEMLRFSLGHDLRPRIFDDCGQVPYASPALYVLNS
ncbi:MAG TPA: glycosyltransferase family 39 protein, partial [Chloroflexota bacterium]